jgi:(p)ppGpp synthase/HD superfamily hydrolase
MRLLTPEFERALVFAADRHAAQPRKGTNIPYVSHLMAVASLVLEHGGTEDEAIAALLHDVVEDQDVTLEEIRREFGPEVAKIVKQCTDAQEKPKPDWELRKKAYIAGIPEKTPEALRVSLADKVHNARSILADLRQHGDHIWSRFSRGREDQLWYYGELVEKFRQHAGDGLRPLVNELDRVVGEMSSQVLERAIALAVFAHAGQKDKAGAPYILHPFRVMAEMTRDVERIAAVLHDAVEDSKGRVILGDIEAIGAPAEAVEAVDVLTRSDDGSEAGYTAYIERLASNPIARRVKLADLKDNLDTRRLRQVTEKDAARLTKYLKTYAKLQAMGRDA